jgi:hypothetical protein
MTPTVSLSDLFISFLLYAAIYASGLAILFSIIALINKIPGLSVPAPNPFAFFSTITKNIGIVLIFVGGAWLVCSAYFLCVTKSAEGEILSSNTVGNASIAVGTRHYQHITGYQLPIVSFFVDNAGNAFQAFPTWRYYRAGDRVKVFYDPHKPRRARTQTDLLEIPLALLGVGLFWLLAGRSVDKSQSEYED